VSEQRHPVCHDDAGCDPANNFTEGTGNIVEFSRAGPGIVWVYNDTCAHFYLRLFLRGGRPVNPPTYDAAGPPPSTPRPAVRLCETP
jgi:hypothetical protein